MNGLLKKMAGCLFITGTVMANTAPTPVIVSCAMREGTTLMDITYRVNDPDDAVVSAWPLAFVDGTRSFAKVIRPATFAEGTENNFGTNVLANTNYQLVWNVGADWNIDLGQIKFEIICKDSRGLLPFDWVSIPATATTEALTISKNILTNEEILNAFFYQYGAWDGGLSLSNGVLKGSVTSGIFSGIELVNGTGMKVYAPPYVMKQMNVQPAFQNHVGLAISARSGITSSTNSWYARIQPYSGISNLVVAFGQNLAGQCNIPAGSANVKAVSGCRDHVLLLNSGGTIMAWGANASGQCTVPAGLSNVVAIAAGHSHSLVLKGDGTVVAWGANASGQCTIPAGLSNVTSIVAGYHHNLALKSDGNVVAWGRVSEGQCNVPVGLSNVISIAAGESHSMALKGDGTVVAWGTGSAISVPVGLSNVTSIVAGTMHSMALKEDGSVVAWGHNGGGQSTVPPGLSNVTAMAAGMYHSLALKSDGTVVVWGFNHYGQSSIPPGLSRVMAIEAGEYYTLMIVKEP